MNRHHLTASLVAALLWTGPVAVAHPVQVDGNAAEWSARTANVANVGILARDAAGHGEFIWRDALADTRTDISTPEVVADIAAFQVTGNVDGVAFLLRRQPGVALTGAPIQVQIAVDTDQVPGFGQDFLGQFADTKVSQNARWERLVVTSFGSGGTAQVVDTAFNQVAVVPAVQGPGGDVEIQVPWSALGMLGAPLAPLRFTVATFRAANNDITVDIGGSMFSNVLDEVGDYGDPAASAYPNTYQDVQDLVVDHWFDVFFDAVGEVYAPVLVERLLAYGTTGGSDEWLVVQNVSPSTLNLEGFKLGDEETPDGVEGMFNFPVGSSLAPGARFTVARNRGMYQTFFGTAPDAEFPPSTSAAVPDMVPFTPWMNGGVGNMQLANGGDAVLVLDASNTVLDVVAYGLGSYPGVTAYGPFVSQGEVLARLVEGGDSDDCQVDFHSAGQVCVLDADCGSVCTVCELHACGQATAGTACPDGDACNGDEVCDAAGTCVPGASPPCDDQNPCTADSCTAGTGCMHTPVMMGISCSDGDVCNGAEVCSADGECKPGAFLDCDDTNPCTLERCDAMTGCQHDPVEDGVPCADGNACNGDEVCSAGMCKPGQMLDCDDQNLCTMDACDPVAACMHSPASSDTSCEDGIACTVMDHCDEAGGCVAGADMCGTSSSVDGSSSLGMASSGMGSSEMGSGSASLAMSSSMGGTSLASSVGASSSAGPSSAGASSSSSASSGAGTSGTASSAATSGSSLAMASSGRSSSASQGASSAGTASSQAATVSSSNGDGGGDDPGASCGCRAADGDSGLPGNVLWVGLAALVVRRARRR